MIHFRKKKTRKCKYFLVICGSICTAIAFYISPAPFPLCSVLPISSFLHFLPTRVPPLENVTAAILSYAVSHLHEDTGKLRKTCADTVGHFTEFVPRLQSLKKWPPAQRFDMQAADQRSPIQALTCLTWTTAWSQTPTTHRTLSVRKCKYNRI